MESNISDISTILGNLGGGILDSEWGLECGECSKEVFLKELTLEPNLSEVL